MSRHDYVIEVLEKDIERLRKLYTARLALLQSLKENGQPIQKHKEALKDLKAKGEAVKEVINMIR